MLGSDTNESHYSTSLIQFHRREGLLGASTNGAMPQNARGFVIESNIVTAPGGIVSEDYWLKVEVASLSEEKEDADEGDIEYVLKAMDIDEIERVMASVVEVGLGYNTMPVKFKADLTVYQNGNQLRFSQHQDEWNGTVDVVVERNDIGVINLSFICAEEGRAPVNIARLQGRLTRSELFKLMEEFNELRLNRSTMLAEVTSAGSR
jgi:hypothetical protein